MATVWALGRSVLPPAPTELVAAAVAAVAGSLKLRGRRGRERDGLREERWRCAGGGGGDGLARRRQAMA